MLFDRFIRLMRSNLLRSSPKQSSEDFYTDPTQQAYKNAPLAHPEASFYAALELPMDASFEAIRKAYKAQMKQYHPDRFHGDPQKQQYAEQVSQRLNEAYTYFEKKYGK